MSILELSSISKSFGPITAVNEVSFSVDSDSIVGLIGPNGSGKTTIFNIVTGLHRDYSGTIRFDGKQVAAKSRPDKIKALGIARTFQNIRLFLNMTVLENVMVGMHCLTQTSLLDAVVRISNKKKKEAWFRKRAYEALEFFGPRLTDYVNKSAFTLSYANRRRLEIARAMVTNPKVLLLDEPAAGMNPRETEELMQMIRTINSKGIAIVVIEHDMNVIMGISGKVVVVDYGAKIAEGSPEEILTNERVAAAYLGVKM